MAASRFAAAIVSDADETSQDLAQGQSVIVTARWILILAGLAFSVTPPYPDNLLQLQIQVVVIFALAIANFFLHAQLLMKRPVLEGIVYASSAADITVITLIILARVFTSGVEEGFSSTIFVFYFPALLALSVAFPRPMTVLYAGGTIAVYALIAFSGGGDAPAVLTRLVMMAAVAFCGTRYLSIERGRRREALEAQQELLAQVHERPGTGLN